MIRGETGKPKASVLRLKDNVAISGEYINCEIATSFCGRIRNGKGVEETGYRLSTVWN